jgi:hypothetical protein
MSEECMNNPFLPHIFIHAVFVLLHSFIFISEQ